MKNKSTTAILAFLLGSFGAHRFYLGQNGAGCIYLLFCWTLIPTVIALVDGVSFLTASDQAFNALYNQRKRKVTADMCITDDTKFLMN